MNMSTDEILHVIGTWVVRRSADGPLDPGQVRKIIQGNGGTKLTVDWLRSRTTDVIDANRVDCGLRVGFEVLHDSQDYVGSLGMGRIVGERTLAGRRQMLVDFYESERRAWIPWQRLRFAKGAAYRFKSCDKGGEAAAEKFRLRNLAHALKLWNENTGALSRFDIDPLPHQIHLVHHILGSGNLNWLIADDVGLGKTIEAGLLIAALRQRKLAKRVLLVVPAGLTKQWQEDLRLKFGMDDFLIYGTDFSISKHHHWKLYDRVIVSMDKAKGEGHLDTLLASDIWDLVIFDEAHRLTRRQWGMKFKRSDRYKLAEALRANTQNMLLLTATPHQGKSDQFEALLELLRPELRPEIQNMALDPSILSQMVFRNRKSDVTDINGNFVFHGQTSTMVRVETSPALAQLEQNLHFYLQQGYRAATQRAGNQGKAIGFVMTVYRKLAASSIVALEGALLRRLARLRRAAAEELAKADDFDERFEGEFEEVHASGSAEEFFAGEIEKLKGLVSACSVVGRADMKMGAFLDRIIAPVLVADRNEKVLIFTEYRGTQDYIVEQLVARYGEDKVDVVNGSMAVDERLQAIDRFEHRGQFLVSTEAGGEGINLHRHCHILVNFDLPWNPMRLAQRIGRLYRYGQKERVLAFNLQGVESADEIIVAKMYERLEEVAATMATVDGASSENLVAEIMGQLAGVLDIEEILETSRDAGIERSKEQIEDALELARRSAELQRDLFQHAVSYDASELNECFPVGSEHLRAFVFGMVRACGGAVRESRRHPGEAWRLDLPDAAITAVPGVGRNPLITFDRELDAERGTVHLLDMDHPLVQYLIESAGRYDFQGLTACIELYYGHRVVTGMLRWQNEVGERRRQEYVAVAVGPDGCSSTNPSTFAQWLLEPAETPTEGGPGGAEADVARTADSAFDAMLAHRCNRSLHPESREWLSAAWCASPQTSNT